MKLLFLLFITATMNVSCGNSLEDYARNGGKNTLPSDSVGSTSNPMAIKVSPGSNQVSGNQLKGRVSITPTVRAVQGNYLKANFSFHQSRPN